MYFCLDQVTSFQKDGWRKDCMELCMMLRWVGILKFIVTSHFVLYYLEEGGGY